MYSFLQTSVIKILLQIVTINDYIVRTTYSSFTNHISYICEGHKIRDIGH